MDPRNLMPPAIARIAASFQQPKLISGFAAGFGFGFSILALGAFWQLPQAHLMNWLPAQHKLSL
jgi:hypothetical protein